MATIRPFRGYRYNQLKIKNLSAVVTPPYDVISGAQQSQFYQNHPYNFIRIILGKEKKDDNSLCNKYTRAKDALGRWICEEAVAPDKEPSIYIYEQGYKFEGAYLRRRGFIALLKLESTGKGVVFPHEKTFCKPKEDRLALLKATQANLSPIFGFYADDDLALEHLITARAKAKPICDFLFEGVRNKLWRISDDAIVARLERFMKDKQIFIADGHHRYEVAYAYHQMVKDNKGLNSGYVMMYFCSLKSKGLKVLPTHRVVRDIPSNVFSDFIPRLESYFHIQPFTNLKALLGSLKQKAQTRVLGLYVGAKYYLLDFKVDKGDAPLAAVQENSAYCYNELDVVLLHSFVLRRLLGIKEQNHQDGHIWYTRDEKMAVELVKRKKYQAAFFLNPPSPQAISAIARCFQKMPHKSTYFYPKPVSGLVINMLEKPTSNQ